MIGRALLVAAVLALAGCGGGSESISAPANPDVTLDASKWAFYFSPGMPTHPDASLSFVFPREDGVHYLLTGRNRALTGASITVEFTVRATTDAVFTWHPDQCGSPATARLMIERSGDDLQSPSGRWWATAGLRLKDGTSSITVPLTPDAWSNVDGIVGSAVPAEFADALANAGNVGMTFGGGCFYGHGVWLSSGSASFTLTKFESP